MADKQHQHPGGRICTLCDDGEWRYGDCREFICEGDHPAPAPVMNCVKDPGQPWGDVYANGVGPEDDRGEFGMPTVGGGVVHHTTEPRQAGKATTQEARRIMTQHLPRTMERFLKNNAKYAKVQTGHDLGAKGIIPDINRKTGVLIDRIWDGSPTVGEETPEVIEDLIGHLLLLLDKVYRDEPGPRQPFGYEQGMD